MRISIGKDEAARIITEKLEADGHKVLSVFSHTTGYHIEVEDKEEKE